MYATAARGVLERGFEQETMAAFVIEGEQGRLASACVGCIYQHLPGMRRPNGLAGIIMSLTTEPAYQRSGYATAVVSTLMRWFDERRVGRVDVHSTVQAELVYRRLGLGEDGDRMLNWGSYRSPAPWR